MTLRPERLIARGGPDGRGGANVTVLGPKAQANGLAVASATSRRTGPSLKVKVLLPAASAATAKVSSRIGPRPGTVVVPVGKARARPTRPLALWLAFTFNVAVAIAGSLLAATNWSLAGSNAKVKASAFSSPWAS